MALSAQHITSLLTSERLLPHQALPSSSPWLNHTSVSWLIARYSLHVLTLILLYIRLRHTHFKTCHYWWTQLNSRFIATHSHALACNVDATGHCLTSCNQNNQIIAHLNIASLTFKLHNVKKFELNWITIELHNWITFVRLSLTLHLEGVNHSHTLSHRFEVAKAIADLGDYVKYYNEK